MSVFWTAEPLPIQRSVSLTKVPADTGYCSRKCIFLWVEVCGNSTQYHSKKKEAAVKTAISKELSKAVIIPIKFFEISGQWDVLVSHLGNVCTCKGNSTAEFRPSA